MQGIKGQTKGKPNHQKACYRQETTLKIALMKKLKEVTGAQGTL